jgi:5-methylcytosine-specific restriction protein B
MFDREGFKAYVGINSGNSYASGLESIEKEYGVDIDFEIGKDHGAQLLARINVDKKLMTGNDRKNRQNWYSHLKKYISYKEGKADTEWMPFYAELADQLLEYKQNRQELLARLHRLFQDLGMKSPFMEKDTPMTDVDPFTVFGCFNKGISDANRVKILKAFKRAFSINAEVPENFSGIPVLNNFMAAFFAFKNNPKRSPHDIDNLWELFQAATDYADVPAEENKDYFIDCFDRVKEQPVIRWNITMGLFWIRPYSFINLDERNREYLGMGKAFPPVDQMIAGKLKSVPAGAEYLEIIGLCKDAFRKTDSGIRNFVDLSRRAWIATNSGHAEPGEALAGEDDMGDETMTDVGLNTILYGPPGTGKTYHTVIYAVAIIENRELEAVAQEEYAEVLERYNEYKTQGRIEFTTFHQSYGYEEFIEGIRPDVVDDGDQEDGGDIRYSIQPGVFKKFCEKAERPAAVRENSDDMGIRENASIWKVSIEGAGDNPTRKECLENGHIRIGWDEYGKDITDDTVFHYGGKAVLNAFINKMQIGDIVLSCYSASIIDAIGVVTGEYEWNDHYEYYRRVRKVKWLAKGIRENILDMNGGKPMTLSSVYRLSNIAIADVYRLIEKYQPAKLAPENPAENYVFIIDEINRGNISKIFGELITLIEATKRVGLPEGMKAVLPYSQKPFGVPKNVYIIGTMNTADRSIATIDTALRRRFLFREMMPQPDVLAGVSVEDLNVSDMLTRINKRISVLYDREHTVGHAYFMPLKDNPTMEVLAEIFTNNIIPLLQEYFYEDYEKIRLVLGDNRKDSEEYQFIIARENDYSDLFGDVDVGLDDGRSYEINYSAFSRIEAYRAI